MLEFLNVSDLLQHIHAQVLIQNPTVERNQAMQSFIFSTEKKDGKIKARACTNGSTQQNYTDCNEAASPTAIIKPHVITAVMDTK